MTQADRKKIGLHGEPEGPETRRGADYAVTLQGLRVAPPFARGDGNRRRPPCWTKP